MPLLQVSVRWSAAAGHELPRAVQLRADSRRQTIPVSIVTKIHWRKTLVAYTGCAKSSATNSPSVQATRRAGCGSYQVTKACRGCFLRLPSSSPRAASLAGDTGERDIWRRALQEVRLTGRYSAVPCGRRLKQPIVLPAAPMHHPPAAPMHTASCSAGGSTGSHSLITTCNIVVV
jgi:hypothetical protein